MGPGTRQLPKVPESIDPFEQFVDPTDTKSLLYFGGSLAAPEYSLYVRRTCPYCLSVSSCG